MEVELPKDYVDILDRLVEKGIYLDRGEYIREALRALFRYHGIERFCIEMAKGPESSG